MQKRILYFLILFSILNISHSTGQVVIREDLILNFGADSLDSANNLKKGYWDYWHFTFTQSGKVKITIENSNPEYVDFCLISPEEIDLPEQPGSFWRSPQVYLLGTTLTFANKDYVAVWEYTINPDGYTVYCYHPDQGVVLTFRLQVIYEGIDHFFVECTPDTIVHSQKTYINAEARDIFDQKVSKYQFIGNLYVDVKLDADATQYGKLDYDYLIYPDSPTYEADDVLKNVHYYNVMFNYIYFNADKQVPAEIQDINVTIKNGDDSTVVGTSDFYIMQGFHGFHFSFQQDTLSYPDTTRFFIRAMDINDQEYPLPLNTSLDLSMDATGDFLGSFINSAGSKADRLSGLSYEQVRDEGVRFTIDNYYVTGLESAIITVSETSHPYFNSSATVYIVPTFDHFEVTVIPDTVAHGDTATIIVQAKDRNDEDVTLSGNTQLIFSLDESGARHGSFLDSVNSRIGKSFNDIFYSSANVGGMKYIADGKNPCGSQQIVVTVKKSSDTQKTGAATAAVRCKLEYTYYSQGDPAWRDDLYDFYKRLSNSGKSILQPEYHYKIREKGCALACMAMVLKSAGYDYNPLSLNNAMNAKKQIYWGKNKYGNWSGAVVWKAVNDKASSFFTVKPKFIGTHEYNWLLRKPINIESIDNDLNRCNYVVVLVANNNNNHWVIVTKKKMNQYLILDPGNSANTTLNSYDNTIYRAVIYERRCDEN
ncbi:hypothetical protein JXJ21_03595 [candidate division KSB1 bacterium]|nr:hypothetical protein [candidate division KSB1 bacterium]